MYKLAKLNEYINVIALSHILDDLVLYYLISTFQVRSIFPLVNIHCSLYKIFKSEDAKCPLLNEKVEFKIDPKTWWVTVMAVGTSLSSSRWED